MPRLTSKSPTVFVVDDDPVIRACVHKLAEALNLPCQSYHNGCDFLEVFHPEIPGCLVLDIQMPQIDGLEVHRRLLEDNVLLPVIMLTGQANVDIALGAMKAGVFDFIQKPLDTIRLKTVIEDAIQHDANIRQQRAAQQNLATRLSSLSKREHEVYEHLLEGKSNRSIADEMNISTKTVEHHRARVFEKMQVKNVVELAKQVFTLLQEE